MKQQKVGVYKDKATGKYRYALLSEKDGQATIDKHMNDGYCVIIEVDLFSIVPSLIDKHKTTYDKFYDEHEIMFGNQKLVAKVVNGVWINYG